VLVVWVSAVTGEDGQVKTVRGLMTGPNLRTLAGWVGTPHSACTQTINDEDMCNNHPRVFGCVVDPAAQHLKEPPF
jgi:hypothetical protein